MAYCYYVSQLKGTRRLGLWFGIHIWGKPGGLNPDKLTTEPSCMLSETTTTTVITKS